MKEKYTFSKEKLNHIIKSKGLNKEKMSIALGRSHGYLYNGMIDKQFLEGLEKYYCISGKDIDAKPFVNVYKVSKSVYKVSKSVTEDSKAVDYDELYKYIYGAVYQAVKKALNE